MASAASNGGPVCASKDSAEVERFVERMAEVRPTIPDEVVDYFLARAGFCAADVQVKRIIALAADHFVSSVAHLADQSSVRQWQEQQKQDQPADADADAADADKTLTMEALQQALLQYGIDLKRPDYWVDP